MLSIQMLRRKTFLSRQLYRLQYVMSAFLFITFIFSLFQISVDNYEENNGYTYDGQEITYQEAQQLLQTDHTAQFYQNDVQPTIDGMLGNLSVVHPFDCQTSLQMIKQMQENGLGNQRALDIGAGIGRISHYVLHQKFQHVDMIEQCQKFIDESRRNFAANSIDNRYCCSLQDIDYLNQITYNYDIIWIQWVIGHVDDQILIDFLKWCKQHTKTVVIKDNLIDQSFLFDKQDFNIIRSDIRLRQLIQQAGWKIQIDQKVKGWEKFHLTDIKFIVLVQQ